MKLFYAGLIAALCMAFHAEAKPKKPSNKPPKADVSGKKTPHDKVKTPKKPDVQPQVSSEQLSLDGFLIPGRKLTYQYHKVTEMYYGGEKIKGWQCPAKGSPDMCRKTEDRKVHCTIDKVEDMTPSSTLPYTKRSVISCDDAGVGDSLLSGIVGGCWMMGQTGVFLRNECEAEDSGEEIFINPVKVGEITTDKEESCSSSEGIIRNQEGFICKIWNTDCGDGNRTEICYHPIEGLVSFEQEFSGGTYVHQKVRLLNPILPEHAAPKGSKPSKPDHKEK